MKNDNAGSGLKFFTNWHRSVVSNSLIKISLLGLSFLALAYFVCFVTGFHEKTFLFFCLGSVTIFIGLAVLYLKEQDRSKSLATFLSILTETTGACLWEWDVTTNRVNLIPGGLFLFGKDVKTLDDFAALVHPDDIDILRKATNNTQALGSQVPVEFRIQNSTGSWRWFVACGSTVEYASDGTIAKIKGSTLDIDDHKRAVEGMRGSEKRLSTIFRSAPGSMAVTDNEGRLIDANQAFYDMLGYSAEELQGVPIMSFSEGLRDKDSKIVMADIFRECESYEDRRFHIEENFLCRDGRRITVDFGLSSISDTDGIVQNYIFSGIDVTQQKKHAAELKLLAENQRWLFDFLRQFNQFDGIVQLFEALQENLPQVISFSSLKLIVPSFLNKPWVMDNISGCIMDEKQAMEEVAGVLAGVGPLGRSYVGRTAIAWGALARDPAESDGGSRSVLAIPLLYKEKPWGVMSLESVSLRAFSEQDVTLMSIVGSNIGLYLEEQRNRSELDVHADRLQQLHSLIHTLLRTRNRDHLLEGMLGYLKSVISDSVCAVYLFVRNKNSGDSKLERLAWYDEENIPVPESDLVLKAIALETPLTEYGGNGLETRRISPIIFQTHNVGAVDLYKPSGMQPSELKMLQLLVDYVSGFWVLYDLMALREEEASVDLLTGIWNRRYMIHRLQEESDRIARYGGNAGLVIGDMGNFKHTNDNYGHAKGDEVLVKAAAAISKNLRFSDSVGRYGGDEFIILLPNVTKVDADTVIQRIRLELEEIQIRSDDFDPDSPMISVVMDFGLALFPGGAPTLMDTINLADEAMYLNKNARKARAGEAMRKESPLKVANGKTPSDSEGSAGEHEKNS